MIEATGLGQLPINEIDEFTIEHSKIFDALKSLINDGTVIALAPQTIYGRLQMNVYAPARKLRDIGIIGHGNNTTPETTFIKLAWLLSNYSKDQSKRMILQNIAGELSDCTAAEEYLN